MSENKICWSQKEVISFQNLVRAYDKPDWPEICENMKVKFDYHRLTVKDCQRQYRLLKKKTSNTWTHDQIILLFKYHLIHGNKWKQISNQLNGKSVNQIKNKFYSILRKRLRNINKMIFGGKSSTSRIKNIRPQTVQKILYDKLISGRRVQGIDFFVDFLTQFDNAKWSRVLGEQRENFKKILTLLSEKDPQQDEKQRESVPYDDNISQSLNPDFINIQSQSWDANQRHGIQTTINNNSEFLSRGSQLDRLNQTEVNNSSLQHKIQSEIFSIRDSMDNKNDYFQDPSLNFVKFDSLSNFQMHPIFDEAQSQAW